jgi:hypothetical protein
MIINDGEKSEELSEFREDRVILGVRRKNIDHSNFVDKRESKSDKWEIKGLIGRNPPTSDHKPQPIQTSRESIKQQSQNSCKQSSPTFENTQSLTIISVSFI